MFNINDILKEIRTKSSTWRRNGYEFEKATKSCLLTDPRYINLEKVLLCNEQFLKICKSFVSLTGKLTY